MVSTNQRRIHEGIRKVIGSSNRGFASIDPERQRGIFTEGGKVASPSIKACAYPPNEGREVVNQKPGEGSSSR